MKVTLRQKAIANSKQSLYLDFYPAIQSPVTGKKTRREFLKLYIYEKAKTSIERKHNKETKALAENIRAKRQIALQNGNYDFLGNNKKNIDFLDYFKGLANKRNKKETQSNYLGWLSAYKFLYRFTNGNLLTKNINETLILKFKEYLLSTYHLNNTKKKLAVNSAQSYFMIFKSALNQAHKEKLINENPGKIVKGIQSDNTKREFLTIEEIQKLAQTECKNPTLKKAALFSAFTGLRWSDVEKLEWKDIEYSKKTGYYLNYKQQKTKSNEILPISEQVIKIIGKPLNKVGRVFDGLKYTRQNNERLKIWILQAGITKYITFHCFRHTYATLLLSNGVNLYTVSKMLGHKSIKTTEIYAKVMNSQKVTAASVIPNIIL